MAVRMALIDGAKKGRVGYLSPSIKVMFYEEELEGPNKEVQKEVQKEGTNRINSRRTVPPTITFQSELRGRGFWVK